MDFAVGIHGSVVANEYNNNFQWTMHKKFSSSLEKEFVLFWDLTNSPLQPIASFVGTTSLTLHARSGLLLSLGEVDV